MMSRSRSQLAAFSLCLLAVGCGGTKSVKAPLAPLATGSAKDLPLGNPSDRDAAVPIDRDDPVWGSASAPVTIVEFSDFECPFCKKVEPAISKVQATYGPDKVRIVWKNEPLSFHRHARPAAEAAAAVFSVGGSEAFWRFHDALIPIAELPDSYDAIAQKVGVDVAAFRARLATGFPAEKITHDLAVGEKLGVDGTPAFFVNGVSMAGAVPYEAFQQIVDAALGQAKALLDKGTAPDHLYATAVAVNYAPDADDDKKDQGDDPAEDTTSVWKVAIGTSPVRGNKDAPVTLVEFGDFECAYCKKVEPTVAALATKYGDKLRIVWKNNPLSFHARAEPTSELALEARAEKGDAAFWSAHDRLMAATDLSDSALDGLAKDLGLAPAKVKKALDGHLHKKTIEEDTDLASLVEARGTPLFFINGRKLVGAQPEDVFSKMIDEEIAHADALTKSGTAANKIYDAIVASGKTTPDPSTVAAPIASAFAEKNESRGKAGADVVTIVEYGDFQCPFCKRVEPTLEALLADPRYKLRVIWQNHPLDFHDHAELAAEAAVEAGAQKGEAAFWKMHNLLFEHQGDEGGLDRAALDSYAQTIGLDLVKFRAALDGKTHAADIAAEGKQAEDASLEGTPSFVIFSGGGKMPDGSAAAGYAIAGAVDSAVFRRAIELAVHAPKHATPRAK